MLKRRQNKFRIYLYHHLIPTMLTTVVTYCICVYETCACKREQRGKERERVNMRIFCVKYVFKANKELGLMNHVCNLVTKAEDCHEFKTNTYYIARACLNNNKKKIIMVPEIMNDSFSGLNDVQKRCNCMQSI